LKRLPAASRGKLTSAFSISSGFLSSLLRNMDSSFFAIQFLKKRYKGGLSMPIRLRMPAEKEERITKVAVRSGETKTAFILEAVDEKLGLEKSRAQLVRELAGWMSHEEAEDLRKSVAFSRRIHPGDWE